MAIDLPQPVRADRDTIGLHVKRMAPMLTHGIQRAEEHVVGAGTVALARLWAVVFPSVEVGIARQVECHKPHIVEARAQPWLFG